MGNEKDFLTDNRQSPTPKPPPLTHSSPHNMHRGFLFQALIPALESLSHPLNFSSVTYPMESLSSLFTVVNY